MIGIERKLEILEETAKQSFVDVDTKTITLEQIKDRIFPLAKFIVPVATMKQISDVIRNLEIWVDDQSYPIEDLARRVY